MDLSTNWIKASDHTLLLDMNLVLRKPFIQQRCRTQAALMIRAFSDHRRCFSCVDSLLSPINISETQDSVRVAPVWKPPKYVFYVEAYSVQR